jgi:methionyl-tRNA synthetase
VDPFVLADKYSVEALRYYLMSDIATGKDADFSEERLIERYNANLANSLGNLLSRTLNMVQKYSGGVINVSAYSDGMITDLREKGQQQISQEAFPFSMDQHDVATALALLRAWSALCDDTIEKSKPWKLITLPKARGQLDAVLYSVAETLRIIAILISPLLPRAAHGIFDQLNWKMELSGKEERFSLADAEWGKLPDGHVVGKPVPLFPRIEIVN